MASINELRFCLEFEFWEAEEVQTEIFAGALGRLGTLGAPTEIVWALGTMQTSGVNLR